MYEEGGFDSFQRKINLSCCGRLCGLLEAPAGANLPVLVGRYFGSFLLLLLLLWLFFFFFSAFFLLGY